MNILIQKNIPLANFSTFKIGGEAEYFIEIKNKQDLEETLGWAKKNKLKIFILGGGSNVLINSDPIKGLVVKIKNQEIVCRGERLECGAGAALKQVLSESVKNSLSGLEWTAGIPNATIGGAVRGNAGAFNESISDIVETIEVFDSINYKFKLFSKKDCEFAYRESFFKKNDSFIVWSVVLKMFQKQMDEINKKLEENLKYRMSHQPKLPSAGSVFKNVSFDIFKKSNVYLANKAQDLKLVKNNSVGVGWIIDMAGDLKGKKIGGAKVSLEHANFIVNTGNASSDDVVMLISYIKQQVRNKFKIQLQEEIQYFGF